MRCSLRSHWDYQDNHGFPYVVSGRIKSQTRSLTQMNKAELHSKYDGRSSKLLLSSSRQYVLTHMYSHIRTTLRPIWNPVFSNGGFPRGCAGWKDLGVPVHTLP